MQSQNRENYIVVNILDLDPKKNKFGEEEKSEHGGFYIPIFYDEKTLFVKYGKRTCPFGIRSGLVNLGKINDRHFLSQTTGDEYRRISLVIWATELDMSTDFDEQIGSV